MGNMKKWSGGILAVSLFMLLELRYGILRNTTGKRSLPSTPILSNTTSPLQSIEKITTTPLQSKEKNTTSPLEWIQDGATPPLPNSEAANQVLAAETLDSSHFFARNLSDEVQNSLLTWNHMKNLDNYSQSLPLTVEAIREGRVAWKNLVEFFGKEKHGDANNNSIHKVKEKQCPPFIKKMNAAEFGYSGYGGQRLQFPCGLIQDSAITIVAIPYGGFQIDLMGETLAGKRDPPIILHYNVRLQGEKTTEDPVIVQNTWTAAHGWGEEARCPSPVRTSNIKVDELIQCNEMVDNYENESHKFEATRTSNVSRSLSVTRSKSRSRQHFPFKQGTLSVMTLRVGEEGIQMTVDGRHTTSFAYRQSLEPWLVSEVRISGDMNLISFLASGLPTSENSEEVVDLEALRSAPLSPHNPLDLFIGIFSTANNFNRRMAVRRTWMQYKMVRTGGVAVRFFVGLHRKQMVNEELWNEVETYGDIQLMPFVDYYNLITLKTLAICIFGVVSASYVMKTDDDAFVRVDEVVASINRTMTTRGLIYGLINYNSNPDRNPFSKWYISHEEWPEETYPPWAHGPGYVVSHDIAQAIYKKHKQGRLKMFKLEDVAMGIWIEELKNEGSNITYKMERRVYHGGCNNGYVVAHYQSPQEMLCLWQILKAENKARCCGNR